MQLPACADPAELRLSRVSPVPTALASVIAGVPCNSSQQYRVSVAAEMVRVLVRSVKEPPLSSTVPPPWPGPSPKNGIGGTSLSPVPPPPICHRGRLHLPRYAAAALFVGK